MSLRKRHTGRTCSQSCTSCCEPGGRPPGSGSVCLRTLSRQAEELLASMFEVFLAVARPSGRMWSETSCNVERGSYCGAACCIRSMSISVNFSPSYSGNLCQGFRTRVSLVLRQSALGLHMMSELASGAVCGSAARLGCSCQAVIFVSD